ncbi:MAG: DMT family transporter [Corynebacterium sp.]|nr:DMT family transporter [Corynebacterium sp.]
MHNNALAVLFAFASALTIAWGTVVRHRIAENLGAGKSMRAVIRRPLWWAGTSTALIAYGLQAIALGFGSLLAVQPVLVLKLMLSLPMSARFAKRRISKAQLFWASLLTVSVGIMVIFGRPLPGQSHPSLYRWIPAIVVGLALLSGLVYLANHQLRSEKAVLLGIVTGGTFGYVSLFSKATVDLFVRHGWQGLVLNWEPYVLVATAIIGTILQQYAFNAGSLKDSLPAMTVGEPIFAFVLGYLILGEKFTANGIEWLFMGIALVVMIISTFALSRDSI